MSKELEALNFINNFLISQTTNTPIHTELCNACDLLRTALKDYEHLCQIWNCKDSDAMIIQTTTTIHNENNKKLKALEIIKETLGIKLYYLEEIKQYTIEIGGLVAYPLKNKEEYDLLKEVLL